MVDYALQALEALVGCDRGLASLQEAGGQAALESYLAGVRRSPVTEDGVYRAQQMQQMLEALNKL